MAANNIFGITIENYPNSILLGNKVHKLTFRVANYSTAPEKFEILFESDNIELFDIPQNPITLEPAKPIPIEIGIKPLSNGQVKITVKATHLKTVEYFEKVWKVRDAIEENAVKRVLDYGNFTFPDIFEPFPEKLDTVLPQIDSDSAKKEWEDIKKDPAPPEPVPVIDPATGEPVTDPVTGEPMMETPPAPEPLSEEEKNRRLLELAERVFNTDPELAFGILEDVTDKSAVDRLVARLLPVYASRNFGGAVYRLEMIDDSVTKKEVIKRLIRGCIKDRIAEAIALNDMLGESGAKDHLFISAIGYLYPKNLDGALGLLGNISDQKVKVSILFELLKHAYLTDKSKVPSLAEFLIDLAGLSGNMQMVFSALVLYGAVISPAEALKKMEALPDTVKSSVENILKGILMILVDEKRTKIERIPVAYVYYTFNAAVDVTPPIEMVASLGGNISENLLTGNFSVNVGMICPFKFKFPIYPAIETAYSQIKQQKGKSFYYMIIPTDVESEEDFVFVQTLLNMWFVANEDSFKSKVYIFNTDFMPYLGKPTIIVGSDPEENTAIASIVKNVFGDSVNFIIDDGIFKGGRVYRWLTKILPSHKFKVINLVMTYDFLTNYMLLKTFMDGFVK